MASAILGALKRVWTTKPLLANCITYGSLYTGAELSQQVLLRKVLADKKEDIDWKIIGRYFLLGSAVFPPFLFYWYRFLDAKLVGRSAKIIVSKVLIDQCVTAPPIIFTFYTAMSFMEGKADIFAEVREKMLPTFQKSCAFWLPAQAVNFTFLPTSMRVVYIGTCSFLWVNILCVLKRAPTEETGQEDDGSSTLKKTD